MKLLIYIEPTTYLMPLWHEICAHSDGKARIVFLEENLTQSWDLDLQDDPVVTVLRGTRWAKFKALLRLIWRKDVKLVHLAGWGHPLLLAAMTIAWLRRIPVTMETDTPLPLGLPVWKRAIKRVTYPILFKLPAMFLPGGTRQAAYLRHYGVEPERIQVAQMTVDVGAISAYADSTTPSRRAEIRAEMHLAAESVVFLYVGRLELYKGVSELAQAFAQLPCAYTEIALLWVGDGSMRKDIEKSAGADPRIGFTGRLAGKALLDAYVVADVLVLPSRSESWGLVVNEAMACGLAVIATERVGCVDDLVLDGKTGLLVPAESVQALIEAMTALHHAPLLREKMRRNARSLIADWTIQKEAQIMKSTWNRLLEF
jgi:glycosyltransferase involved in cell wall biosynthesis